MEKNILSEIDQIKFLFGYKPGKVLSEQSVVPQNKAWDGLKKAIEGMGTDEEGVKGACAMITTPQIYQQVLAAAKKEGYKTVMEYILTDFDTMMDQPVRTERTVGTNYDEWKHDEELGGLWSKDSDTQTCVFCARTMKKFNEAESDALWDGARVDRAV